MDVLDMPEEVVVLEVGHVLRSGVFNEQIKKDG